MATNREKQLAIALLTERIQNKTGKKVKLVEKVDIKPLVEKLEKLTGKKATFKEDVSVNLPSSLSLTTISQFGIDGDGFDEVLGSVAAQTQINYIETGDADNDEESEDEEDDDEGDEEFDDDSNAESDEESDEDVDGYDDESFMAEAVGDYAEYVLESGDLYPKIKLWWKTLSEEQQDFLFREIKKRVTLYFKGYDDSYLILK